MATITLVKSTDGTTTKVIDDPLCAHFTTRLIKYAVQRQMFCPITRQILDYRKCAVLFDGQPDDLTVRLVLHVDGFVKLVEASAEVRGESGPWLNLVGPMWVRMPTRFPKRLRPVPAVPAAEDTAGS